MKKIFTFKKVSLLLALSFGLVSSVYAGDGTENNPYTVAEGIALQASTPIGWVKGYIVGSVLNDDKITVIDDASDVVWGATNVRPSVVLIAASADVKDYNACLAVNLPSGAIRSAINLVDNPSNLGKEVLINGKLRTYFSIAGLRDVTAYSFAGDPEPTEDVLLDAPFATGLDNFTAVDVAGAQGWSHDASYKYVKISGYDNGASVANEDWLVSPTFSTVGKSEVNVSFDHAIGPNIVGVDKNFYTLWISENLNATDAPNAAWVELNIAEFSTTKWQFVSSKIALPTQFLGKSNLRIGFKYLSSDSESATWELKNVKVVAGAGSSINPEDANSFDIYATAGYVNVTTDAAYVEIYNTLGQLVSKTKVNEGLNSIPVAANKILLVKAGNQIKKVITK